jgi:hypothetical protein
VVQTAMSGKFTMATNGSDDQPFQSQTGLPAISRESLHNLPPSRATVWRSTLNAVEAFLSHISWPPSFNVLVQTVLIRECGCRAKATIWERRPNVKLQDTRCRVGCFYHFPESNRSSRAILSITNPYFSMVSASPVRSVHSPPTSQCTFTSIYANSPRIIYVLAATMGQTVKCLMWTGIFAGNSRRQAPPASSWGIHT